jgi:flavodoxin
VQWQNVQVFPLIQPNGHDPSYALIDDLLGRRKAEITEIDEGGAVPTIAVRNRAPVDALILDGTELHGAKQNRMVNVTVIAGKGTVTPIPVSCVEQGRWSYRSRHFSSAKRTVASKLRNLKAHMVSEHLARSGRAATAQGAVWDRVQDYVSGANADSPTAAMDDAFRARQVEIDAFVARLKEIDAYGAVVAVNGEIIALDLVDHRDTFRTLWESLLRGYAMDASMDEAKRPKRLTKQQVETWLASLTQSATLTPHAVPGVGEYYAVRAPGVAGGCTMHQGRVVHTALFPATE